VKFTIDEETCIDCGACRRYCPVDCIPYEGLQHQIVQEPCTGCTICYAVCPVDAVIPLDDGRATPKLTFEVMEFVRTKAFVRGPHQ